MRFVYLIGAPAVGKTTLLTELAKEWSRWGDPVWEDFPVKHQWWRDRQYLVMLGHPKPDGFGGTDVWGFDQGPKALRWLATEPAEFVVGEGDRFAVEPWLRQVHAAVIWCTVAPQILAERRRLRTQNLTWVKGRETKVYRLALAMGAQVLDTAGPVAKVLNELKLIAGLP